MVICYFFDSLLTGKELAAVPRRYSRPEKTDCECSG